MSDKIEAMSLTAQVSFTQVRHLRFGDGTVMMLPELLGHYDNRNTLLLTVSAIRPRIDKLEKTLEQNVVLHVVELPDGEPKLSMVEQLLSDWRGQGIDAVVGIGGGSVLDVSKVVAAFLENPRDFSEAFGIGKVGARNVTLACLPTTSGTGSEVSPNSILYDTAENLKKGIVDPCLVPDIALVDPELTHSVPPAVTAATGIDALTHCIESYTNVHARALVDNQALAGIELIAAHLERCVRDGRDREARAAVALGSLYGGLCLGPVNTAAVHALSYPLGSAWHVPHGVSNAVLLPHVCAWNLEAAPERYARMALALGCEPQGDARETALKGVERLKALNKAVGIPTGMSALGVPEEDIPEMARAAVGIERLMKNNPREISVKDAERLYRAAY